MILAKDRTPGYEQMMTNLAGYLHNRGYENIRAQAIEGYDDPSGLQKKDSSQSFTPDITARKNGDKHFFEIVDYPQKEQDLIVTKWMLLSTLARRMDGSLVLVVPHGKMSFTNRILRSHGIQANVLSARDLPVASAGA